MADRPFVTGTCVYCGGIVINIRPWVEKKFCSHACQCKASRDKHWQKRPKKGKPLFPVEPWDGPLCFCGAPGRYEGKCGSHNFSRRYNVRKRNALIKQFVADADVETLRLAIVNYGNLESLIGGIRALFAPVLD